MRTKIIAGTIVATFAAVSLYAAGNNCNMQGQGYNKFMQGQGGYGNSKMGQHQKGFKIQSMIQNIGLTVEQQTKVDDLFKKHMDDRISPSDAFSKTDFDKDKFISITSQKRDNMIKSRADMIEGIYNVLTPEQKLQLKVMMDMRKNNMQKGFNCDRNSYGRG